MNLTEIFQLVVAASWQSALIIALILLVRLAMGTRVPARWRYLLWMLLLIRLLVPVFILPPSPVSLQNIPVVAQPMEQIAAVVPAAAHFEFEPLPFAQGSDVAAPATTSVPTPAKPISIASKKPAPIPCLAILASIWLGGVIAVLGFMARAHVLLWRRLETDTREVHPGVRENWRSCCVRMGVKRAPDLRASSEMSSPALVGFLRPLLLIPAQGQDVFSREDWENVFVHELAHYRRADHWANALQLAALALHWFNPVVWFGFRQLRADRELAADEWAIQHLQPGRASAYGATLLKVLAHSSGSRLSAEAVGILEDGGLLKQRLHRIVTSAPRTLIGSAVGLALVVGVAVLVLGRQAEKVDLSKYDGLKPQEIFVAAARDGDVPALDEMLRRHLDINSVVDLDGKKTPLIAAASSGQLAAVQFLVSKGADVNKPADEKVTAIQQALDAGHLDCAEYLAAHGAAVERGMIAAAKGDTPVLQAGIDQAPPLTVDQLEHLCRTAAQNDRADACRLLMTRIRSMPGQDRWALDDGMLLDAIAKGHKDIVQFAIDSSPNSQKLNQFGVLRIGPAAAKCPGMREWLISKGFNVPEYSIGEQLIDASENDDVPGIERLLKAGADINYRGESSWTPITKAATWNKPQAVKYLLAHGADPNSVHLPGWDYTSICLTPNPQIADMLLKAGGNINAPLYKRGVHIISYCIDHGPIEMVKWFIAHGVDPAKVKGDNDRTFLYEVGNPEIAELLIQRGIDPKYKDKSGRTALYWICQFGNQSAAVARVLLQHGADANARDKYGITPLMVARDGATVDVLIQFGADIHAKPPYGQSMIATSGNMADASRLDALVRHGVPFDPKIDGPEMMINAAHMNHPDIIAWLLSHGVDPNQPAWWNKEANMSSTGLETAVTFGNYEAARLLIEHGASVQDASFHGKPGIDNMVNALANRRANIVKLFWDHGCRTIPEITYDISQGQPTADIQTLLDKGASPDPPKQTITPLALAAELGQIDTVKLLISRGAKPETILDPKAHRTSTLYEAAGEGQDEIVALLLQHGAKVDPDTMWWAVWNCNPYPDQRSKDHFEKTIQLLLDAGGAKGIDEKQANRLLCAAIFSRYPAGNTKVVQMLLDHGVNLHARDEKGHTVMDDVREACKEQTCSTPTKDMLAFLEPLDRLKTNK